MPPIYTPQTRCRAAVARCDITPPAGIYHRMWGAATHDRATGVHKPLLATLLRLEPESGEPSQALLIVALDHCILDGPDIELIQKSVAKAAKAELTQVLVTLAHTHAAGLMSRSRAHLPGGELIGPYLDELAAKIGALAAVAASASQLATVVYGHGRCTLAANRDFFDAERDQFVCGFNPAGPADETVLVAKISGDDGRPLATVVNYACHPTTLAWQNSLISPDFVGAVRETLEYHTSAPCLFLQGASGDLGPRDGFVGDPSIADKNGRQLAFAALSVLESLPSPRTKFAYVGSVVSGATIGVWEQQPLTPLELEQARAWNVVQWDEPLAYRDDLPSRSDAEAERERWQRAEIDARASGDEKEAQEAHARVEQANRQLWRLSALPPGTLPLSITLARLGRALWLFVPGEHYQFLQTTLRASFPDHPLVITTLTDGWQPGYIPPTSTYGRGIYQEQIAVVAPGAAEQILQSISHCIEQLGPLQL